MEEVVLIHILSPGSPSLGKGELVSSARERMESDRLLLQQLGIPQIKTEILESESVAEGIEDAAMRYETQVIVMGARGRGLIKGIHLGSVTNRVLHISSKNLLIMRGPLIETLSGEKFQKFCPMIFSRVLIPVDLSTDSWIAVNKMAEIPDVTEIIIGFVISRGETEHELERIKKESEQELRRRCNLIKTAGAQIRWRILEGDLVSGITDYANEEDVSLICTVPTEKGFFAEILYGSFSCELARHASRPVLVIRRPK